MKHARIVATGITHMRYHTPPDGVPVSDPRVGGAKVLKVIKVMKLMNFSGARRGEFFTVGEPSTTLTPTHLPAAGRGTLAKGAGEPGSGADGVRGR
jgi:hypothetical protein